MCRWAAYAGPPAFLDSILLSPVHSLIEQSHSASEAKTAINGDGFGLAWYDKRDEPGQYRDILPAWADCNLQSLAYQIKSPLFMAHVRASTTGATNRTNCHPFTHGTLSFMHNGQIGQFERYRRQLEALLSDELYNARQGTTDSELMFLLAVGYGLAEDPQRAIERMIEHVVDVCRDDNGQAAVVRFTACFSDGKRLDAVRFSTDAYAPSLYMSQCNKSGAAFLVSEPFEANDRDWKKVTPNSYVSISNGQLMETPFLQKADAA